MRKEFPIGFVDGQDPVAHELEVLKSLDYPSLVGFKKAIADVKNERFCIIFELFVLFHTRILFY